MNFLNWLDHGFFNLSWWGYILVTLGITHITILTVTIFLHRCQAHRSLDLHPIPSHFFRLWAWMTTGMVTKEWAAIHRKHHAFADKEGDPHSPHVYGLKELMLRGAELYKKEAENKETIAKYGNGTPDDWLERNLYSKYDSLGVWLMLTINVALFGVIGVTIWAVQMMWIPFFAAGVINGLGHWFGYRNFENPDKATNLVPWGILIGGEELHNNHHTFATSAKLSAKWYEFDLGWMWIRILAFFKLAKVKKTIPEMYTTKAPKLLPDLQSLEAIVTNRYALAVKYARDLKSDYTKEMGKLKSTVTGKLSWSKVKTLLIKDKELLTPIEQSTVEQVCKQSPVLQKIFAMREELSKLWARSAMTKEELVKALQDWCKRAEESGIESLRNYSLRLRSVYC